MFHYLFPLCIQLPMPNDLEDHTFLKALQLLEDLNFYGVELNVLDPENTDPTVLKKLLASYNLKMTMFATGAYAKLHKLSLSSTDETIRKHTVNVMCQIIVPFAEKMGCDVICGFIKGDTTGSAEQLRLSIQEISAQLTDTSVKIYLEATNHYESAVINRVSEGAAYCSGPFRVLPDTYHMNIEEASLSGAISAHSELFQNIHISDNNRYFPGFGAIDFFQVFQVLKARNWSGTVAIEGRNLLNLEDDIQASCSYLNSVSERFSLPCM